MTATADTDVPPAIEEGGEKGLKAEALGFLSSLVIGISSTAPAYSLAATMGFVVVAVGLQAPIIMILAFVPMLLIAVAYQELNRVDPDCGTTFTWGAKAFGPRTGWMGGWGIIAADVIVMANLAQIAGQYGFSLVGAHQLVSNTFWTTFAGVTWIVIMTAVCYIGIEISARIQYGLLAIEVVMLGLLSVVALTKVWTDNATSVSIHPAWSWFNPFNIRSFSALSTGMLLAVFIYWGWDTAVSVNEETKDRGKIPGRAAVASTLVLLGIYALVTVAVQAFAGTGDKGIGLANSANSGDVLSILGDNIFGRAGLGTVLTKLLVLMVLTSAAASTLTTILPTARTSLSMAAYRAIPQRFVRVHKRYLTPTWSTVGMGLVSIAFYVVLTTLSTNVLKDSIGSVGLLIAFYYGLTGFICVWFFRHQLTRSWRDFALKGLAPFTGGAILLAFFVKAVIDYSKPAYGSSSWTIPFPPHWHLGGVLLTGIGSLVFGVVLMVIYRFMAPAYFRGDVIGRTAPAARAPVTASTDPR